MDLEGIILVENLSTYNFEDAVFLAADIDAIVERLMRPVVIKDVEKILFLAHLLKTTLDICRTIVHNYETLEELLQVNWSATGNGAKKWEFYGKLKAKDPVNTIASRILLTKDGERCLGIMQEFYRMHSSKEAFKEMLLNVHKSIPCIAASNAFKLLKTSLHRADNIGESSAYEMKPTSDVTDIVMLANFGNSPSLLYLEEFQRTISNPSNDVLDMQMLALRKLFKNATSLKCYQEALRVEKFYDLNILLLKLYHDRLVAKNLIYDNDLVMLLYLLQNDGLHDAILRKEFLNETRLGSRERLRIILLELQNFH